MKINHEIEENENQNYIYYYTMIDMFVEAVLNGN